MNFSCWTDKTLNLKAKIKITLDSRKLKWAFLNYFLTFTRNNKYSN